MHKITARFNLDPVAETRLSGVGGYSKRLAEALAQHPGFDIEGFYFNFRQKRPLPQVQHLRYHTHNFPLKLYAKLASYGLAPACDFRLKPVDVTFFPNFVTWPTVNSKLKVTTVHDLTFLYFPELVESKNLAHLRRVVPRTLRQADLILTVSQAIKNEIISEFSINPDQILALPIPVSDLWRNFNPQTTQAKLPSALAKQKYISFVGNFEPRKNLPVLIEAYLQLPEDLRQSYKLVIAGSQSWQNQQAQTIIDHANSQHTNIFQLSGLGDEEIANLVFHSSLHILPSLYEGFGMPIVEAMTVGTPVIASDIPVLHESSGGAAVYFNPHSANNLSHQIIQTLTNQKLRKNLIKKGKNFAENLNWQSNIDQIYQTIHHII